MMSQLWFFFLSPTLWRNALYIARFVARISRYLFRAFYPAAMQFGTLVQQLRQETAKQGSRRAFLFSTAEHRERIISASFPTSYAALSRGGERGRSRANFAYKNNGRVPHYFTLRTIVPTADASRIVMRAASISQIAAE